MYAGPKDMLRSVHFSSMRVALDQPLKGIFIDFDIVEYLRIYNEFLFFCLTHKQEGSVLALYQCCTACIVGWELGSPAFSISYL